MYTLSCQLLYRDSQRGITDYLFPHLFCVCASVSSSEQSRQRTFLLLVFSCHKRMSQLVDKQDEKNATTPLYFVLVDINLGIAFA